MKPLYVKKNGVVYKISGNGMPASYPAADVEYDNTVTSELQATDVQGAIDELSTRQDTNTKNTAYGTCDTAGNVKDKVATLSNATNWVLEVGTIVGVRFTYTNTYTPSSGNAVTLNVNNTGAKNIRYGDGVWSSADDTKCPTAFGEAGQTIYYMYDGTYWVWVSHSKDNDTLYNFVGREFRSCDFQDAGLATGFGGDANLMVVNGVYYYNSNGPSTSIGASANDGSVFVHVCDDGYVVQIAQNYETGNIFVRAMNDNVWGAWKKPIANITGNNTVLTTDKTPFLTRQTLNPTGFSGYVREKLIGASYAWNNQLINGNFSDGTTGWSTYQATISASNNVCTMVRAVASGANSMYRVITKQPNHKYLWSLKVKNNVGSNSIVVQWFKSGTSGSTISLLENTQISNSYTTYSGINATDNSDADGAFIIFLTTATVNNSIDIKEVQVIDLTLAFGSTIADYLYSLANNGGITKLRDMGFPIDKYTPYGYGLYSVKTSGKKIVGKNLFDISKVLVGKVANGLWSWGGSTSKLFDLKFKANTQYTFSGYETQSGENKNVRPRIVYTDGTVENIFLVTNTTRTAFTKTSVANKTIDYIQAYWGSDSNAYVTIENFQIEEGSTATTYEPYSSTTYPLGNDELRGKFDLVNSEIVASGDVKESNGEITRNLKLQNLGDLDYIYRSEIGTGIFSCTTVNDYKLTDTLTALCGKYTFYGTVPHVNYMNNAPDKSIAFYYSTSSTSTAFYIKDSAYNNAATLKSDLNGTYMVYPLATPTTEQSTPFADPMSLVGATTEEYIDTRDIPCPVGAERQYMGQSEDVVEIPSSPLSDGKRILISEVSGGKEQVYWDSLTKLNYHDYTVKGDGTTTWGDLLSSLRPIYESLSENEKTFSKLIFRPESISGNECLSYCGAYWYSRMGLNSNKTLWIDHASLGPGSSLTYYYQKNGDTFIDKTSETTTYSLSLRVFVEVGSSS